MSDIRLRASHLTRRFPGGAGIDDIDLVVPAGRIHALVGLNGAGKTTLMRALLGMLRPTSGHAELRGEDPARAAGGAWRHVGHLVDGPFAYPELTVEQNVRAAARLRGIVDADAAHRVIDDLRLGEYASRRAKRLSLGNRQRLGIAAALVHDPDTIVLDEPTNALDPAGVIAVRESIRRRADAGAAILVSSHHLDEVARVADDITVINRGRVVGALDPGGIDLERAFFALVHADDEAAG